MPIMPIAMTIGKRRRHGAIRRRLKARGLLHQELMARRHMAALRVRRNLLMRLP